MRDDKLLSLLPSKDSPYSFEKLSEVEASAFDAALGDGFGGCVDSGGGLHLPKEIDRGLLRHAFFTKDWPEGDEEELEDAFWFNRDSEVPAPFEWFPLGFNEGRLRIYFANQLERFYYQMTNNCPAECPGGFFIEERTVHELALRKVYEKPWYEFHAVQLLNWIDESKRKTMELPLVKLGGLIVSGFSGQLGRLVEQYSWRFRFEKAAITGFGARQGASAGGKAKARLHHDEHSVWQKKASEVWARRPRLSKTAVAEIVRRECGTSRTAKHIARFISPDPGPHQA